VTEEFIVNVWIRVEGDETKKNAIRNKLSTDLTNARNTGQIIEARLTITTQPVSETLTISPV